MNRITILPAAALCAGLAVIGCGSGGGSASSTYVPKKPEPLKSAMVQPGQESTYFPFAKGSQWTFDSETTRAVNGRVEMTKKQEVTYRIDNVVSAPNGGKDATFTVLNDGQVNDMEIWRVDSTGIYQIALGSKKLTPLNPPQTILPFPVKEKATFKWEGTLKADNGEVRKSSINGVVVGEEPIDTDRGPYNALAVENRGTLSTPNSTSQVASKLWLIPGIGIGRYRMEIGGTVKSTDPKMKGRTATFDIIQLLKLKNVSLK